MGIAVIGKIILILLAVFGMLVLLFNIIFEIWVRRKIKEMDNLNLDKPTDFLKAAELCFGPVEEKFEGATLLLLEQYAQEQTMIYDFSKWEDSKIIGVTVMHKDVKPNEDDEDRMGIVPNQTVCRFKDGTVLWVHT